MVPGTGIEPVRRFQREILSLLCLPISPSGRSPTIIPSRERPQCVALNGKWESAISHFPIFFWSGRRVSNSRPIPWQGIALPTELLPQKLETSGGAIQSRTGLDGFAIHCITALLSRRVHLAMASHKQKKPRGFSWKTGAGNESRTRDLNLGKVALYQLSYSRKSECALYSLRATCQRFAPILKRYSGGQAFLSCSMR